MNSVEQRQRVLRSLLLWRACIVFIALIAVIGIGVSLVLTTQLSDSARVPKTLPLLRASLRHPSLGADRHLFVESIGMWDFRATTNQQGTTIATEYVGDDVASDAAINWVDHQFRRPDAALELRITSVLGSFRGNMEPVDTSDVGHTITMVQMYHGFDTQFGAVVYMKGRDVIHCSSSISDLLEVRPISICVSRRRAIELIAETIGDADDAATFMRASKDLEQSLVYFESPKRNLAELDLTSTLLSPAWAIGPITRRILVDCESGDVFVDE